MKIYTIAVVMRSLVLGLFAMVLLTGCGISKTVIKPGMDKPLRQLEGYNGSFPLVTIRYPVGIDPHFTEVIHRQALEAERQIAFSGYRKQYDTFTAGTVEGAVSLIVTRSHYLAIELYQQFSQRYPKGSVILEPAMLTVRDETIVLQPEYLSPPTPVVIEYGVQKHMIALHQGVPWGADTNGKHLSNLVVIEGFDISGQRDFIASHGFWSTPEGVRGHGLIHHLNGIDWGNYYTKSDLKNAGLPLSGRPATSGHSLLIKPSQYYGQTWFTISENQLENYQQMGVGSTLRSPFNPLWDRYINITTEYLNSRPTNNPTGLTTYANMLGIYKPIKTDLIRKALSLETRALADMDEKYSRHLIDGGYGQSVRSLMAAELDLEQNWRAAQDRAAWGVLLGATMSLSGSLHTQAGNLTPQQNMMMQMTAMDMTSQSVRAATAEQAQFRAEFDRHLSRTFDHQQSYSVQIGGSETEIRFERLSEFREQLARLLLANSSSN